MKSSASSMKTTSSFGFRGLLSDSIHAAKIPDSKMELEEQKHNLMEKSLMRRSVHIDNMFNRKLNSRLLNDIDLTELKFSSEEGSSAQQILWTKLCTGSGYYGLWNQFGFNGHGLYRFSDGLLYDGQFKDGHFHGKGRLIFQNGNRIEGFWEMGMNKHMKFVFVDGLEFKSEDWGYCVPPDHRYAMSEYRELKPIGKHDILPDRHHAVPNGCYLTSEGYYNPKKRMLHTLVGPNKRPITISRAEGEWIVKNCALVDRLKSKMDGPSGTT